MENDSEPRVIEAEIIGGSVLVTFNDGKAAVYSASLLKSKFSEAVAVVATNEDRAE